MSILLISVQPNLDIIGLKGLHHVLLDKGHSSTLLYLPRFDIATEEAKRDFDAFVQRIDPKIVGISLMAIDYYRALAVTQRLKESFPHIPVLWGGLHPTTAPESCLQHADYICIGECEQTIVDIAEAAERGGRIEEIRNVGYLDNGVIKLNPLHPLVEDLDTLPVPMQIPPNAYAQIRTAVEPIDVRLLRKHKRWSGGVYKTLTSRGCPYACSYCANSFFRKLYPNWRVRQSSVAAVMRELEMALHNGPPLEYVDFNDDCFLASDIEYLREFCAEYKARIGKPFIVKGTPRYITREKMDLLVDAGLAWVNLGLQSGSERVCSEIYRRKISPQEFLEAAGLIHEYPVAAFYDVILDNPFETTEDVLKTAEIFAAVPKPFYPLIFSLICHYGTEIHERLLRERPEAADSHLGKSYEIRQSSPANDLVELAAFLHAPLMRALIAQFRKDPNAVTTRVALQCAKLYSRLILTPITYFRLIKRTQNGSVLRTLKVLPVYLDHGLVYYLNNFTWFRKRSSAHLT